MKGFTQGVSDLFTAVLRGFIYSISGGFCTVMIVTSVYQSPFFTLLTSLLLGPLLIFDLYGPLLQFGWRKVLRQRDWTMLAGRLLLIMLTGAFVLGFIRIAVETIDVRNLYSAVAFFGAIVILFPIFTVYYICKSFFPDSLIVRKYDELTTGAVKSGLFWPTKFPDRRDYN